MKAQRRWLIGCVLLGLFANCAVAQEVIDMKGKTALVTGSTSGLGENVARRLGALGATVIIHGLNEERGKQIAAEITAKGPGRAIYYPGDLASLKQVDALAERVKSAHPRLDLLINNAGIGGASNGQRSKAPMDTSWCSRSIICRTFT
jgi:NAD(P)-dependent dehydrogenase (short-subunit alcohol dehydrogenase family)